MTQTPNQLAEAIWAARQAGRTLDAEATIPLHAETPPVISLDLTSYTPSEWNGEKECKTLMCR